MPLDIMCGKKNRCQKFQILESKLVTSDMSLTHSRPACASPKSGLDLIPATTHQQILDLASLRDVQAPQREACPIIPWGCTVKWLVMMKALSVLVRRL